RLPLLRRCQPPAGRKEFRARPQILRDRERDTCEDSGVVSCELRGEMEMKNSSYFPEAKDFNRIANIVARSDNGQATRSRLARNMANAITDFPKLMRRANAA